MPATAGVTHWAAFGDRAVVVTVKHAKTDQEEVGREVAVPFVVPAFVHRFEAVAVRIENVRRGESRPGRTVGPVLPLRRR
jgi:hypothetical protein